MVDLSKHFTDSPAAELYHYTSISGFMGIVESKRMWATDLQYMNDTKEIKYAGEIVEREILDKINEHENFEELNRIFRSGIYNGQYANVYGISFSEERDLLSQWRGYGGDAGMAICFSPQKLADIARKNQMFLVKCIYDQKTQADIVSNLCNQYAEDISKRISDDRDGKEKYDAGAVAESFFHDLSMLGAIVKHPAFKDENEWRMVSGVYDIVYRGNVPLKKMGFRAGSSTIIPYLNVSINLPTKFGESRQDLGFHDVLIGPTSISELPWRAVSQFLDAQNVSYSQISPSGVPLRSNL